MMNKLLLLVLLLAPFSIQSKWDVDAYLNYYSPLGIEVQHAQLPLSLLPFKGNEECLQYGCRAGDLSMVISQKIPYGQLIAMDREQDFIKRAWIKNSSSNIYYQRYNPAKLTWNEKFDYVFSFYDMHWQPNINLVLQTMYQALKKGGKALVVCVVEQVTQPHEYVLKTLQKPVWKQFSDQPIPFYVRYSETIVATARSCGFSPEFIHVSPNHDIFENKEELYKMYCSLPLVPFMPEDLREVFFKEVIDDYTNDYPASPEGHYHQSAPVLTLVLKK